MGLGRRLTGEAGHVVAGLRLVDDVLGHRVGLVDLLLGRLRRQRHEGLLHRDLALRRAARAALPLVAQVEDMEAAEAADRRADVALLQGRQHGVERTVELALMHPAEIAAAGGGR